MKYVAPILMLLLFAACKPDTYTPKPRGYYLIELPKHEYQSFNNPEFPYSFEYPLYGKIIKDTTFFGEKPENPYWINIDFPSFGGRIYLSYKTVSASQPIEKLMDDAYRMTETVHNKRADYIEPINFKNEENKVFGLFYNVGGNAASAYQFYATDYETHFLRGALYFDVTPNADSLKPVNEFLRKDIEHILKTLQWH